jgi:hypothetical protein
LEKKSQVSRIELAAALEIFGPRVKEAIFLELDEAGYSFEDNDLDRLKNLLVHIGGESLASVVMKRLASQQHQDKSGL